LHTPRHTRKNSSFSTQDEHLGLLGLEALTETPNLHYATRSIYDNHIKKKTRQRRLGGGRKARLASIEDKLLFILIYFKIYPLQEVMASMFAMSQGRVNE